MKLSPELLFVIDYIIGFAIIFLSVYYSAKLLKVQRATAHKALIFAFALSTITALEKMLVGLGTYTFIVNTVLSTLILHYLYKTDVRKTLGLLLCYIFGALVLIFGVSYLLLLLSMLFKTP